MERFLVVGFVNNKFTGEAISLDVSSDDDFIKWIKKQSEGLKDGQFTFCEMTVSDYVYNIEKEFGDAVVFLSALEARNETKH